MRAECREREQIEREESREQERERGPSVKGLEDESRVQREGADREGEIERWRRGRDEGERQSAWAEREIDREIKKERERERESKREIKI